MRNLRNESYHTKWSGPRSYRIKTFNGTRVQLTSTNRRGWLIRLIKGSDASLDAKIKQVVLLRHTATLESTSTSREEVIWAGNLELHL